jgi:antitoxin (DNA-binding transcriptional repressor) of toxin-antitoxin stability system
MIYVTMDEMAENIEKLLQAVKSGGQQVTVMDNNIPIAALMPVRRIETKRQFGALKGQFRLGEQFFEPLPEDELAAWE